MILISHRGNLDGPDLFSENSPEKIDHVKSLSIPVEIDLRYHNNSLYLGHDEPQYQINIDYLLDNRDWLWIHCKDSEALNIALKTKKLNCFWHDTDDYTMTTFGYTWAYPGKEPVGGLCIGVMPEQKWSLEKTLKKSFFGICTDNVTQVQDIINTR